MHKSEYLAINIYESNPITKCSKKIEITKQIKSLNKKSTYKTFRAAESIHERNSRDEHVMLVWTWFSFAFECS